jgi:hypothetical protein
MSKSNTKTRYGSDNRDENGVFCTVKFKTDEDKIAVYKKYCEHVASGLSLDSFPGASDMTMRSLLANNKELLDPDLLSAAKRKAKEMLEELGLSGAKGKIKNFNCKAWQFIMMNKFNMRLNESSHVININADADIEQAKEIIEQIKCKYKRDY